MWLAGFVVAPLVKVLDSIPLATLIDVADHLFEPNPCLEAQWLVAVLAPGGVTRIDVAQHRPSTELLCRSARATSIRSCHNPSEGTD